jgi:hypothetical protein
VLQFEGSKLNCNVVLSNVVFGCKELALESRNQGIGKYYYLVDVGYTNGPVFLSPFRSTLYHLKEWVASQQQPQNYKELYNLRHSRARNVVKRTFGLLKKKWAILRNCSFFSIEDQVHMSIWNK